jgi:N-acyl-D-amino-acid deacylase
MAGQISRRTALRWLVTGAAALPGAAPLRAQQPGAEPTAAEPPPSRGAAPPALAPFDRLMTTFLEQQRVPGAALAVTRGSRLVYARGFGFAEVESGRPVLPAALFRIASLSKPITAVAVLQLAERGGFALDDRVFAILPAREWLPAGCDQRLHAITVRQLLQHTAGWDRDASFDPIARPHAVAQALKVPLPVGPAAVVRYALTLPLDFAPGARHAYSNVGYLLLGRLIEQVSGQPYEAYVKTKVLAPLGITQMQLGRACKGDLASAEVRYYDAQRRVAPAVNGPQLGASVPLVYGGENVEGFEAHGGWIASAIDLVRFAAAFDAPAASPLLSAASLAALFARPAGAAGFEANGQPRPVYYGCGWSVRPVGGTGRANTWHTGLIAGSSALLVRRHDGLNWAVLFNTDSGPSGADLAGLIDPLVHGAADAVRAWPEAGG